VDLRAAVKQKAIGSDYDGVAAQRAARKSLGTREIVGRRGHGYERVPADLGTHPLHLGEEVVQRNSARP
jgi:hypothetical protein